MTIKNLNNYKVDVNGEVIIEEQPKVIVNKPKDGIIMKNLKKLKRWAKRHDEELITCALYGAGAVIMGYALHKTCQIQDAKNDEFVDQYNKAVHKVNDFLDSEREAGRFYQTNEEIYEAMGYNPYEDVDFSLVR